MSAELDKQLADLIERCKRTDAAIARMKADIEQGDRIDSDQPDIDDVADFAANVLGVELYPWQKVFIAAAIDRNRIAGLEKRIEKLERRLSRKSSNIGGESIKIDGESSKNGGGE